ncbi:MAG TPA: DUF1232 domain-containing protein [Methylophilaceae bacterium]|nr:DUF1232 domain-containing protein [Methylophilaceae bacterium]
MGVLRDTAAKIKKEFAVYRLVLKHPETPFLAKILLGLAVGYLLLPFDLIPDFIPVVGHLDDLVIVPALVYAALKLIPTGIVDSCRKELENTHG